MSIEKFYEEGYAIYIIAGLIMLAFTVVLINEVFFKESEPLYVDCESHPDFYLVNDYFDEEGFVYADIDDLKRIVYVGGGVFVGAE
jgi:hypothetical protein